MLYHQPQNSTTKNYNAFFYREEKWENHFHKNFELILVCEGAVNCTVNGKDYLLKQGDFGLCLPFDLHAYHPEEGALYWVAVFSEDHVRFFLRNIEGKEALGFKFNCSAPVFNFLKEVLIVETPPSLYKLKACLYAVCDEYLDSVKLQNSVSDKKQLFIALNDFVSENHKKAIGLNDVADLLNYDYHYMSRFFHSVFNMSFKDFLNLYRLETAIQLLDETDEKITHIAYESGFQSVRNFNQCFKKQFGVTPTEYKAKIKAEKNKQ